MKKRIISFVLVLTLIFTGVFSCVASADSDAISRFYNLYKGFYQGLAGQWAWDQSFFGDMEDLIDFFGEQKQAISQQDANVDLPQIYVDWPYDKWYPVDVSALSSDNSTISGCSYFGILENFVYNGTSTSNVGNVYCVAVPREYAAHVSYSFDGRYYYLIADAPILYYSYTLKLGLSDGEIYSYFYSGPTAYSSSGGQFYINSVGVDSPNYPYSGKRLAINDFDRSKLIFTGASAETPGNIVLTLTTNRDIVENVDGTYMIGFGILYDDGTDRMYCGDYVDFRNASTGKLWEASFNLKDFADYVYRKRCPLTGYKAFIFSYQNGFVFDMEFPIELDQPDGIFDDTEPSPDWKDYEPEPFDPPDPPDFDTNIFNFNFNTNNYVSYTFQTVQNFNYSGGGSGGSGGGGSGNDESSSIDDSSSGSGSGGESSSDDPGSGGGVNINPEIDFDFGLLTAFLDWFAGAFGTLLSNLTGFFGAMLANFELLLDHLFTFFNDFSAYLSGTFNDWLQYFSDLIVGISNYFTTWGNSFAEYIGDCINNFDFNTRIMISNLKQYFDTQFIPDSDNINFILSDCLGWYYQIQQLITSKSYSAQAFTLYLAPFDYTFTLDDAELADQLKTICTVIILGCTALKCVRIGFQTFGINIGGGDSDDS